MNNFETENWFYRLDQNGDYVLCEGSRALIPPIPEVAFLIQKGSCLLKHGAPTWVDAQAKRYRAQIQAPIQPENRQIAKEAARILGVNGIATMTPEEEDEFRAEMLTHLVVVQGRFDLREIDKLLNHGGYQDKFLQKISDGTMLQETHGAKVGQVYRQEFIEDLLTRLQIDSTNATLLFDALVQTQAISLQELEAKGIDAARLVKIIAEDLSGRVPALEAVKALNRVGVPHDTRQQVMSVLKSARVAADHLLPATDEQWMPHNPETVPNRGFDSLS